MACLRKLTRFQKMTLAFGLSGMPNPGVPLNLPVFSTDSTTRSLENRLPTNKL
jgi:hypothetical protein